MAELDNIIDPAGAPGFAELVRARGTRRTVLAVLMAGLAGNAPALSSVDEIVSVKDFGAVGDGVKDDTDAIGGAISYALSHPGIALRFDDTTYLVGGSTAPSGSVFTLDGQSGFTMQGRPKFRLKGTNARQITLFDIRMSAVDIEYLEAVGDVWNARSLGDALSVGLIACVVRSPSGALLTNHRFGTIRVTNGLHALLYDANDRRHGRADGVQVGLINVKDCAYAFNGANAPDNHVIDQIVADNVFRGYFVYGVVNGKANIFVKPAYTGIFAGGTCANIAVYTESSPGAYKYRVGDTRNVEINVRNTSSRPSFQLSTNSMAPTDNAQGHYNIRASVFSTEGFAFKVANASSITAGQDKDTPYASPKRDILVRAYLARNWSSLDPTSYGIWSDGQRLVLECSNFLASAPALRRAYLASHWQVQDIAQ